MQGSVIQGGLTWDREERGEPMSLSVAAWRKLWPAPMAWLAKLLEQLEV